MGVKNPSSLEGKKKQDKKQRNSSLSKIDSMHTKTIKIMDNKSLGGLTLAVCNFSIKNCHLGIPTLAYLKVCIKLIQILWKKYILKNETSVCSAYGSLGTGILLVGVHV